MVYYPPCVMRKNYLFYCCELPAVDKHDFPKCPLVYLLSFLPGADKNIYPQKCNPSKCDRGGISGNNFFGPRSVCSCFTCRNPHLPCTGVSFLHPAKADQIVDIAPPFFDQPYKHVLSFCTKYHFSGKFRQGN